jgi:hypothetical protein
MQGVRQLPVLPHESVREDGRVETEAHVYCPRRGIAMAVDICRACPRFESVDEHAMRCSPDVPPGPLGVAVGSVVRAGVVCVEETAPAREVLVRLQEGVARIVVVDHQRHVVGLVERGVRPGAVIPVMAADLAHTAYRVDASSLVRATLHGLASSRRRVAVVVTPSGPLGTITDVELLHALATTAGA